MSVLNRLVDTRIKGFITSCHDSSSRITPKSSGHMEQFGWNRFTELRYSFYSGGRIGLKVWQTTVPQFSSAGRSYTSIIFVGNFSV